MVKMRFVFVVAASMFACWGCTSNVEDPTVNQTGRTGDTTCVTSCDSAQTTCVAKCSDDSCKASCETTHTSCVTGCSAGRDGG